MKKNYDAVIFDFDGTVADTGKGVFRCIRESLKKCGLPDLSEASLRTFIGPPLQDSYCRECGVDMETADKLVAEYRKVYSVSGIYEFDIYDGMENLFDTLNKQGIKVGIASSKPEDFVKIILKETHLDRFFDVAAGSDPTKVESDKTTIIKTCIEKMNLSQEAKVLMIGDRCFDIEGAHNAGIPCAAVLFGYGSEEEFVKYKADFIAKDAEELQKIIIG